MTLPPDHGLLERKFLKKTVRDAVVVQKALTTSPRTPLFDALKVMEENKIGSILITEGDELKGIFTERDLIKRIACMVHPPQNVVMRDVMTPNPTTISARASIARGIHAMSIGGYRHLPVVCKEGEPLKVLSAKDIVHYIEKHITAELVKPESSLKTGKGEFDMLFFDDVTVLNSPRAQTIRESEPVDAGMEKLCKAHGGCIVVLNAQDKISGIFTEHDYMTKVVLQKLDMHQTKMEQVMTRSPHTLLSHASIAMAINTFAEGNFRHIPIVNGNEELLGLISIKYIFQVLADRILSELAPHPDSPS